MSTSPWGRCSRTLAWSSNSAEQPGGPADRSSPARPLTLTATLAVRQKRSVFMKKYCTAKTVVPILFILLGIYWMRASLALPSTSTVPGSGPATFSNAVLVLMMLASAIVLVQEVLEIRRAGGDAAGGDWKEIARLAALVVLLAAYALLLQKLGFIICSLIMIEASLLLFGQRKPLWLIVIPVGFTGLIYVIFRFALKILLPTIWLP